MVVVGDMYWSEDLCRFAAASYLYYGGIFSIIINVLGLATSLAKWCALTDGKFSLSERRLLWLLGASTSVIVICDVIVVIWVGTFINPYSYSSANSSPVG